MSIDSKCKIFGRWWDGGGSRRETEKQSCERVHQDKWLRELVGGLQIKRLLLQLLRKLRVVKSSSQNTKINAWALPRTEVCCWSEVPRKFKISEGMMISCLISLSQIDVFACRDTKAWGSRKYVTSRGNVDFYMRQKNSQTHGQMCLVHHVGCHVIICMEKDGPKKTQSFISCFRFYCRSCQKQLTGNICWLYRREHWLGVMQWRPLMAPAPRCGTSSSSQLWFR